MSRTTPFNAKRFRGPCTSATMLVSSASSGAGRMSRIYHYYSSRGVSPVTFIDTFVGSLNKQDVKYRTQYWLELFQ